MSEWGFGRSVCRFGSVEGAGQVGGKRGGEKEDGLKAAWRTRAEDRGARGGG